MTDRVFAAVDIGASGGRVMAGIVGAEGVSLRAVHRFPNGTRQIDGHLRWDFTGLFDEVVHGLLVLAREYPQVESIGIDTWAVDYGLLDDAGRLLAQPIAYRDGRTDAVIEEVHSLVPPDELYRINGLQFLPFNTIYQLVAEQRSGRLAEAAHVVLLPDLIAYWLTGQLGTEYTNASTTGLVDVTERRWSNDLLGRLGLSPSVLPALEQPGVVRGVVHPRVASRVGFRHPVSVTTVGSHDTASAVAGLPATTDRFAYVASGTWSLVGVELRQPVITEAARAANFTNEAGIDGRTRFLRNVGGLWLLQESMREWSAQAIGFSLTELLDAAARLPSGPVIDVDDPAFIPPGRMPQRIGDAAAAAGQRRPTSPPEVTRCVIDSLAHGYARTIHQASQLSGQAVDVVHLVGGGSQNGLLCRLTADLTGRPVVAGPTEATALGNITTQARVHGALSDDLAEVRRVLAGHPDVRTFHPGSST